MAAPTLSTWLKTQLWGGSAPQLLGQTQRGFKPGCLQAGSPPPPNLASLPGLLPDVGENLGDVDRLVDHGQPKAAGMDRRGECGRAVSRVLPRDHARLSHPSWSSDSQPPPSGC